MTQSKKLSKLSNKQTGTIELRMPDGEGHVAKFIVDNSVPAANNPDFMTGFAHMLLASRRSSGWANNHEFAMLREACRRNNITCKEMYDAFWLAYGDQYTPASGIEWRHLWKQIETMRKGRDRTLYSYKEMLSIIDRENIDTDHFEIVKDGDEILGWKRI